jgi:hypothetical protein
LVFLELGLIAGRSFEGHFRSTVLWIWVFLNFGRRRSLKVVLISSRTIHFGWVLKAIVGDLLAFVDEGVLLGVVVVLEGEGLELLGVG